MDGILIVDKPKDLTSHDVVDFIRKHFRLGKVGHAGTLDPMATGVLVILIGKSTKDSNSFMNDEKEYRATMTLGASSHSGDAEGVISQNKGAPLPARADVEKACKEFLGESMQVPPMYSAVKYKGKKLYELARKGLTVKRTPRSITIRLLEILSFQLPEVIVSVRCSKGTFIRQLCADIGERLGCGAYLSALRRMRSGRFSIDQAVTLNNLEGRSRGELRALLTKGAYS